MESPTPMPQPLEPAAALRTVTIGVPLSGSPAERRFPITPECAALLVDSGYTVKVEAGGAASINYTDLRYTRAGAAVVSRAEAFNCDIVLHLAPLSVIDARLLRRGALLFGLLEAGSQNPEALRIMLERGVVAIALDLIGDGRGNKPFADILAEIDGRAAVAVACSMLADPALGKGILIGGVAGIVPCEVIVLGSGIAAVAAARSAVGLGAMVRIFDNDVYRLRAAMRELGPAVVGSVIYPHVLSGALRSADIVIAADMAQPFALDSDSVSTMKAGVIVFDLTHGCGPVFPSMPAVDLAEIMPRAGTAVEASSRQVCYINAGNVVPRTAAMALSNAFMTLMREVSACDGLTNAIKILPDLRMAVYTYLGRPVNRSIAEVLGMRHVDINLFLQFS